MALRVLLVDDDPIYWELVQSVFSTEPTLQDVEVRWLNDGGELLSFVRRKPPYESELEHPWPDVVLLDERMTKLDGIETLEAMRREEIRQPIAVCLMTSSDSKRLADQARFFGCRFCFTKPTDFEELTVLFAQIVSYFRNADQ